MFMMNTRNTKGGSITVPLTSCLTGLDSSVFQIKTKIISSYTADSKPVKQGVNGTGVLPPLVQPAFLPVANQFVLGFIKNLYSYILYKCNVLALNLIRKDCFQNKSKFINEDHFTKHMNITSC
jgi:hypothetical protein